jgi:D-beta-D-heptose 7-phosphate kinase/D-beta-D-heptose 1-phosphate adenosyltransferase
MPQQKQFKVLLIGDSCTDEYVYGTCERLNPEAPVPILKYGRKEVKKGMAWNVRENLMAFGMDVYILTNQEKIVKTRYIDERYNQQILRVDEEKTLKSMESLEYEIPKEKYDAVVISDYDKGFITQSKLFEIVFNSRFPVFVDSKKTNLPESNCFIKINEDESKRLKSKHDNLIITKGSGGAEFEGITYPGKKVNVFDVVGAGDTFLSALVYFYLKYGRIEEAIPYANKAAAIAVQNFGTYVLTEKDVKEICS